MALFESIFSMRSERLLEPIPAATAWLLADCMQLRGRQDLWQNRKPETLNTLRERAMVQSVESSNRIEGVVVESARLKPLVLGKARPRDRSEEELAGYRRALAWLFAKGNASPIRGRTIKHLHALAQDGAGDAGEYKSKDNEIVEFLPQGGRRVRFVPPPAKHTSKAIDELCRSYVELQSRRIAPDLLLVSNFVFDFLCIHPFRDGNGRVARLLTTLLLEQTGFVVARYISLERIIEERRDEYYVSLEVCSRDWHVGKNPIAPWWNYLLGVVRAAYTELESEVEHSSERSSKSDLVRRLVSSQPSWFALADLRSALPTVSAQLIKKVLADLKAMHQVQSEGRGRSARWLLRGESV